MRSGSPARVRVHHVANRADAGDILAHVPADAVAVVAAGVGQVDSLAEDVGEALIRAPDWLE